MKGSDMNNINEMDYKKNVNKFWLPEVRKNLMKSDMGRARRKKG